VLNASRQCMIFSTVPNDQAPNILYAYEVGKQ
jgi:hypothetical protein